MIWAIKEGERIKATPKGIATCPMCNEELIAKCGRIMIWHWSHKANTDCDKWGEGESEWHINWKNEFPKEQQEVVLKFRGDKNKADCFGLDNKKHRADILNKSSVVIELQCSSLSCEDIFEREKFYGDMVWVVNAKKFSDNFSLRRGKAYLTFRWYHPRKSWWVARKPIYLDFGEDLFLIKIIHHNCPCGGWGVLISKEDFLKKFR